MASFAPETIVPLRLTRRSGAPFPLSSLRRSLPIVPPAPRIVCIDFALFQRWRDRELSITLFTEHSDGGQSSEPLAVLLRRKERIRNFEIVMRLLHGFLVTDRSPFSPLVLRYTLQPGTDNARDFLWNDRARDALRRAMADSLFEECAGSVIATVSPEGREAKQRREAQTEEWDLNRELQQMNPSALKRPPPPAFTRLHSVPAGKLRSARQRRTSPAGKPRSANRHTDGGQEKTADKSAGFSLNLKSKL